MAAQRSSHPWCGLTGALARVGALPNAIENAAVAVAVHIVCPTLEFLDKGKTRLKVPEWMADLLAKALWSAGKTLYQEAEQRKKDAAKAERQADVRERAAARTSPTLTQKEAVFQVMQEAWRVATGDGLYKTSARWLYYPVRKLIQPLADKDLDFNYFKDLIIDYQRDGGSLPGLYYDPRGVLYEPHTDEAIALGTQSVETYVFPSWLYDKILYVEKRGVWPILEGAQLAERYDMAVIAGEGYASEAIRVLFDKASTQQGYQLFVLHDCDIDGYNICRTLREETARMPGYAVDVIDLGLRWEDAMDLGLTTEPFTRTRNLPEGLQPLLTPDEQRAFLGRPHARDYRGKVTSWIGERVELNALTAPQLVAYIEERLAAVGVRGKIIPPEAQLKATGRGFYRDAVASQVRRVIETLLPIEAITARVQDAFTADLSLDEAQAWVEQSLTAHPTQWWWNALRSKVHGLAYDQWDATAAAVRDALREAIEDGALTGARSQANNP